MPTAAKLIAAITFAVIAFVAAETMKPHLPEGTQFGQFSLICAGIGAAVGWTVMGELAGRGMRAAMGYGIRTSVTIGFWALLGFSVYEMIQRSLDLRYNGLSEGVEGAMQLILDYGAVLLQAHDVLAVLLAGGLLGGLLTEFVSRRWT
ncbi:MAG: TrgA family protein [Paracoccaceae bacterium]